MNDATSMLEAPSAFRRLFWPVAVALGIALAVLAGLGYGPGRAACAVPVAAGPAADAGAATGMSTGGHAGAATRTAPAPAVNAAAPTMSGGSAGATGAGGVAATGTAPSAPAAATVATAVSAGAPPVAKLYFDTARSEVKAAERAKARPAIDYLKAHASATASIAGFHDLRGAPELNAALARDRAKAVAAVLTAAGIDEGRIVLDKPSVAPGTGDLAEARRVELSVRP